MVQVGIASILGSDPSRFPSVDPGTISRSSPRFWLPSCWYVLEQPLPKVADAQLPQETGIRVNQVSEGSFRATECGY
jgi:hypothetical protein